MRLSSLDISTMNALCLTCTVDKKPVYLITKGRLLRRAARLAENLYILVDNPLN